jgi:hypothetical protein
MADLVIIAVGHVRDNAVVDCFGQHATVICHYFVQYGFLRLQVIPGRQTDSDYQDDAA